MTDPLETKDLNEFNTSVLYALIIIPFFLLISCYLARKKGAKIRHFFKKRYIMRSKSWSEPSSNRESTSIDQRAASVPSTKSEINSINTTSLSITF